MPEGPEIWRAADTIHKAISDKEAEEVYFKFDELKDFEDLLQSVKVTSVRPYGKAIVTGFENGWSVYSHNQLYGKWMIRDRGAEPDTNRDLRMAVHTEDKSAYLYSASEIEVLKSDKVKEHSYIKKLGPDVVDPETTFKEVHERFTSDTFKNRKLTTLLLDPGFLSGIGNYLRSEILFCSGVSPALRPRDCTGEQLHKLAEYSLNLSRQSYETGGITTTPELVQALKEEGATRSEYRHYAYGRTGKPCYRCGREIKMVKTGGRKVFYCMHEQQVEEEL